MEAICTINTMNPPGHVPSSRFSRQASSVCSDVTPPASVVSMSNVSGNMPMDPPGYFPNPFALRQLARRGRTVAANTVASVNTPAPVDPPGYFPAPRTRRAEQALAVAAATQQKPGSVAASAVAAALPTDPPGFFPAPRTRRHARAGASVAPNAVAATLGAQDPPGYFPAPRRVSNSKSQVKPSPVAALLTVPIPSKSAIVCDPPGYFPAPSALKKAADPPGYFAAPVRRRAAVARRQVASNDVSAKGTGDAAVVDPPGYFMAPRLAKQLRAHL